MELHRCRCGRPLAAFVSALTGAPVSSAYVAREVEAALRRHLATLAADAPRWEHGLDDDRLAGRRAA